MLGDSIDELQGKEKLNKFDIKIETDLSAYLSKDYIPSMNSRMAVYRQISNITDKDSYDKFVRQTIDIYGDLPEELINLAKISLIKNSYSQFGISKIILKSVCKIVFLGKEHLSEQWVREVEKNDIMSLNFSNEPTIEIKNISKTEILDYFINFIQLFGKNC